MSTPDVRWPRRRDLVRTRAALLDAAAEVFARRGFAAASLEEIAEMAGFTRGAVYHHFGSKEDLFLAVVARRDEELLAGYGADLLGAMPPDPAATVRRWRLLHGDDEVDVALRLELRSHALRSPALRERLLAVERAAMAATAERLAAVAADHGVGWRLPVDRVAELCHLVSHAVLEHAAVTGEDGGPLMETLLELIWSGAVEETANGEEADVQAVQRR